MITDEHFVPEQGLDLDFYIAKKDIGAVHHLIRYQWALKCLADLCPKTVIDVACGAGYGSYAIAEQFPDIQVLGVDYDQGAIDYACTAYRRENLSFKCGDLTRWDETIGVAPFDCVVSFDTIEHVIHREIMMENLVRHLAPNGTLLLSTPSGSPTNILAPDWEHHRIEYSGASLFDFLSRYFRVIHRRDGGSLPHAEVFNILQGTGIGYAPTMNPVMCLDPIVVENPYLQRSLKRGEGLPCSLA